MSESTEEYTTVWEHAPEYPRREVDPAEVRMVNKMLLYAIGLVFIIALCVLAMAYILLSELRAVW